MWALKALLRLITLLSLVTIIPFLLWWIFTGLGWFDTIEEIEYL